jgi:invasion protein IalB
MTYWSASAPARPVARMLTLVAAIAVFSAAGYAPASAQAPAQKAAPKGQQKGGAAPAAPAAPAAGGQQEQAMPPLIYSNWTKICGKGPEQGSKQICQTGKDGRLESGMPVVAAILMEMEGEGKKVLQIMLPPGVYLPKGTRVVVDRDEPSAIIGTFLTCANGGCIAHLEVTGDLVQKLKKGQNLYVQAYNMAQSVMTLALPLGDFAKAYDGPPTDPKQLEEKNKQLQDELQKRANDQRQKLEGGKPK